MPEFRCPEFRCLSPSAPSAHGRPTSQRNHSAAKCRVVPTRLPRLGNYRIETSGCPATVRTERVESKEEMPEVTRFFGIVVRMYFRDHSPAHFHAEYGEYEALVEIETLSILRGELPRRAMALVLEWAALHRQELRADWERARAGTPLESIAPLD